MLKELRELAPFLLGLADDVVDHVRNSVLSASPSIRLGTDRAKALQLSSVICIIFLSIFIKTLSAYQPKIDVLSYSLICLGYFAVVALIITIALRRFVPAPLRQAQALKAASPSNKEKPFNESVDAHSYVLTFNLIALFVFATIREFAIYFGARASFRTADWISACVAVLTTSVVVLSLRPREDSQVDMEIAVRLTGTQKIVLIVILSLMFILYTRLLSLLS